MIFKNISSIRVRLLLLFLPLLIISLIVLAGLSQYFSQSIVSKNVNETAKSLASDDAHRIQANINDRIMYLQFLASTAALRNSSDPQQIAAVMNDVFQRLGKYDVLTYMYLDGSGIRQDGSKANNNADRDYFKAAVSQKKPYVSDPLISKLTHKLSVVIAAPVIENGNVVGVMSGTVQLASITDDIKDMKFQQTGYAFVLDDSGKIVADTKNPELNGKTIVDAGQQNKEDQNSMLPVDAKLMQLFLAAKDGNRSSGSYKMPDGQEYAVFFEPVEIAEGQKWLIAVTAPVTEIYSEVSRLTQILSIIAVILCLLAIGVVFYISKRFSKPIAQMRDEALMLAQGDLRERETTIASKDEIGQLSQGFSTMRTNLRKLVAQVQSQAEQVAASSEELTASAHQSADVANQVASSTGEIAQGTEQQAAAATHISEVAEQMTASTEQISVMASKVTEIAQDTSQEAAQGRQAVEQAVVQIQQIGQGSEAVQKAISELATGSQEIREIVNLISNIAGQTNLLALNAAIEAARAGEHGRGFAVVAEEVRKLAEESDQAAKQIGALIQKNMSNMDKTVAVTQSGYEGVKDGIVVVNSAGVTFEKITDAIMKLSEQIKKIADSINNMATDSRTMLTAIQQIDKISKDNAAETQSVSAAIEEQSASMQEIASSSQNLAVLASDLRSAAEKFKF